MKNIPIQSHIKNYLPADYIDYFSREITCKQAITPETFRDLAFSRLPKWINCLMNLRNNIVKHFGLATDGHFTDMICEKNSNEEIFGMPDKHLTFYVSMWCGEFKDNKQELCIITIVKYNNILGKIYFFVIKPFHRIIIKSILKQVHTKANNNKCN